MDAKAKMKALYRAKLNDSKLEKRIESPLVRYNEFDQPICRVCDVVLKSESLWSAHQASRKHHEAIKNLKANAAGTTRVNNVKAESPLHDAKPEASTELPKARSSALLPPDFFDNDESKRQKSDSAQTQVLTPVNPESKIDAFSNAKAVERQMNDNQLDAGHVQTKKTVVSSQNKQKGALPEGFFDDKDADLRARGIKPVKLDVKDEYKEFEKLIQEDLQEVDDRLEEEEIDAAEMREEAESVEQKTFMERVEIFKKKLVEARSAIQNRVPKVIGKGSNKEDSSSDDDSEENFTVDWRAKKI
ncbi:hypothetical protein NMG60_11007582 [Bertholletia excelsa]